MKLNTRRALLPTFLLIASLGLTAGCETGDADNADLGPDPDVMMAAYMQHATPGVHHAHLAQLEGDWTATVEWYAYAGADPEISISQSTKTMILGGRYLKEQIVSDDADMPFQGIGYAGFDNAKQKYVNSWIDSMTTSLATSEGTCSDDGNTRIDYGMGYDPMTKTWCESVMTTRIIDEDTHTFEVTGPGPDGTMFISMRITYRRAGASSLGM